MRIVHFLEVFSSLTETFIYDFISGAERAGHDNHVITYKRENIEDRPFEKVHVLSFLPRFHPSRIWSRIKSNLNLVEQSEQYNEIIHKQLSILIYRIQPHVIHAHYGPNGVVIERVARDLGIPLVVSFYGYDLSKLANDPKWSYKYLSLFQAASAIIVLSEEMRNRAIEIGAAPCKLRIVHLAKDIKSYPYRKPMQKIKRWITVGRLTEKKGHFDCINAFVLARNDAEAHLIIVGTGELYEQLQSFIVENKLQSYISLLGSRSHNEVKQLMCDSDAFILCSKTATSGDMEGTPTVLLEAQAVGLPCVSTKHAGIPETLPKNNFWLLAEEGNILQIADCIGKLNSASLQELETISNLGRQLVETEFNLEIEVAKLITIYSSVSI